MLTLINGNADMDKDATKTTLWTKERVIKLMRNAGAMLYQEDRDSFIYLQLDGQTLPIDQQLAKQIIDDPRVIIERWREGWLETRATGRVRWLWN